jgi:hypothetical protein
MRDSKSATTAPSKEFVAIRLPTSLLSLPRPIAVHISENGMGSNVR